MKVLDLICALEHGFEGWFASEEDFLSQQQRQLVQCPLCGSTEVRKTLSAPRLNLRAGRQEAAGHGSQASGSDTAVAPEQGSVADLQAMEAAWLRMARHVMAHTEDVGSRFAEEAKRMHEREIPERAIRGQATAHETAQLLQDGITVLPLLLPEAAKNTLQ